MSAIELTQSKNFGFLAEHDALFVQLASSAERALYSAPNTTLIKLRQLGEALAQHIATISGVAFDEQTTQMKLVDRLARELSFSPEVRDLFRTLRVEGNRATHQFQTKHKEAIDCLRVARTLAVWFHRAFDRKGATFKAGPFVPPSDPSENLRELHTEIEQLRFELKEASVQLDSSQKLNDLIAQEKSDYESLALAMDEEAHTNAAQASAHEQALQDTKRDYEDKIQALQKQLADSEAKVKSAQRQEVTQKTKAASQKIVLTEDLTRILIDQQLTDAGWEVTTKELTYAKGIENSSARLLPKGTVCFSRDISVGFTTIMGKEMSTTQHFANWICRNRLNNKYLMYALMAAKEHITISGQGTTVKTIYMPALKEFRILTPPYREQKKSFNG
ncbi:restriction endonuclease subunit S [Microbulbifer sp. GL-2]|uniref:restriction endonuclease subunit S n=1 Tax=Microbulbifer sp. GL-2 TaxID=2591606 RepID=UPI00116360C4|nr:restriction endonuclease subunit S [Microbulbifer sp. GL-2]BBM01955.1 hypothetical protein GL2_20290 [Microbulbifer sp. GL-2]